METLVKVLDSVANTPIRNTKQSILVDYFKTIPTNDLIVVMNILLKTYVTNVGPKQLQHINNQSTLDSETITIQGFYEKLQELTFSKTDNTRVINYLMMNSSPLARQYIKKILLNKLSIGVSDRIALDALSLYLGKDITLSYYQCNDISLIISGQYTGVKPFLYVKSMLAKSVASSKYPKEYLVEYKYDGFRFQYHKTGSKWIIYSRSGDDVSNQCVQIGNSFTNLLTGIKVDEIILDGELVAPGMSFQDAMKKDTPLNPYVFDILYIDGIDMTVEPVLRRREVLERLHPIPLSASWINGDIQQVYIDAISGGYEGIIIKDLHQSYVPNERKWIKMKKSTDSVDLVIMGAEMGDGKRAGLYGSFILGGIYKDTITPFCKVGTGFSDNLLNTLYNALNPYEIVDQKGIIWFEGKDIIVEIDYFEITDSPTYKIGKSLRFPVFKRIRTDKKVSDIQNLGQLLYQN